jgi:hypothetical protein
VWRFKESEEDNEDVGMALAGCIFVLSKISILTKKGLFFKARPTLSKRKILTYASLPYSGFDLNRCPPQTAKDQRR